MTIGDYFEDLKEIRGYMIYDNFDCNQFVLDMKYAGYETEHYCGRLLYEGPAVRAALFGSSPSPHNGDPARRQIATNPPALKILAREDMAVSP